MINLDPGVKSQDDEDEKTGRKIRHNDLDPGVKPQDDKVDVGAEKPQDDEEDGAWGRPPFYRCLSNLFFVFWDNAAF